ncbi:MAG: autoinducer binding domain-containing protein [Rhodobacteraceae bacterium]|nr:autoinducer binding domain-containing protein [Paracoccaceae bacterium]
MNSNLASQLAILGETSPSGYAVGLHVRFTSPTYLFQTYPPAWNEYYSSQGLVMRDPAVAWGFSNDGVVRWSALADQDPGGVFEKAAEHGLAYGVGAAVLSEGSRTLAGFARSDREFTDEEMALLHEVVAAMHALTADEDAMSVEDRATIADNSITV